MGLFISLSTSKSRTHACAGSVEISLAEKRVTVRSSLSQQEIAEAIKDACYTPRFEV
jgi:hypothetical protein